MAAPANVTEFLDLVRKSGVVEEKRLDAHVAQLRASGALPAEPGKVAGCLVRDGLLTQFQAEQILAGRWKRFTIGKYRVLERLGSGGMGQVYLCEHKLMRRRVAVKVLPSAKAADASSLERFYREARAAAALDHPNIVHAYDIDQDETLHFIVMEYVDGASLQEIIKRSGPMDPVRAAHYVSQAALGLEHAHKSGLIHRDIKPGNVLVDRTGVVKILDMGLARFFNDEEDMLTKKYDENVLGTADYLAPEQAIDSHNVDIRADIYGLGATFYFMLSGKTPFGEGSTAQKLIWHQTRQPRSITEVRSDVPAGLGQVIEKMMAKDPAQRYQNPGELAEALAPWTGGTIALPTEVEMPRLSLAATGVSPTGEPTQVSQPSPAVPPSGPRKAWQLPPAAKPSSSTAQRAATPPPARPAPAVQVQPAPAPRAAALPSLPTLPPPGDEDDSIPWERVTSDTEDLRGRADTAPRSDPKPRGAQRRSGVLQRPTEGRRFWRLAILVTLLLVGTFIAAGYSFGLFAKLFGRQDSGAPRILKVGGQAGQYRTVADALKDAKANDRIVLMDPQHRERLRIDQGRLGTVRVGAVTIEAADGVDVAWLPPADNRYKEVLLHLDGVRGLKVRGVRFNGENRQEKLALITGYCPGVTLEDVALEGFQRTGLTVINCAGDKTQPVRLLRLRDGGAVKKAPKDGPEAAILFDAKPNMQPPVNEHLEVRDCRFLGAYRQKAVRFTPKGRGPDMTFTGMSPAMQ